MSSPSVTNFTGAISNVNAAFQNSNVGTFIYSGYDPMVKNLDDCIAALFLTDPNDDREELENFNHKLTEGTCTWILEDGAFKIWQNAEDSEQQLIWVCDGEGMGKTMLAIFISHHLEESLPSRDDYWVLYYFCDKQDEKRNTAVAILRGLMYQLFQKRKELAEIVWNEYKLRRENLFEPRSFGRLWKTFRAMINASEAKRIYFVIDGVDQCDESSLQIFLKKLNDYFTRHNVRQAEKLAETVKIETMDPPQQTREKTAALPTLRMIILSRHDPKCLAEQLSSFPCLRLKSHRSEQEESDLERFIAAKADEISTSSTGTKASNEGFTQAIMQALDKGEDRSFLWVNLAAQKLMGIKQSLAKKFIAEMPATVAEMYIQTLLKIPSSQQPQCAALLMWVSLAVRPLSSLELIKAVKYSLQKSFGKRNLNRALKMCEGLVRKRGTQVVLAHQSVQELLFEEQSLLRDFPKLQDFVFERTDAHSRMANTCVEYLQGTANLNKSRRVRLTPGSKLGASDTGFLRKHPFLEYSIVHWTFHAKKGNSEVTNYDSAFFKENSPRRRLWWESYWISLRQLFAWKWTAPGRFSLLHLAAFFGIVPLASYVEQKRQFVDLLTAEDSQGMKPINWATEKCQAEMVKFLLQRGDFDDKALRQAARTGDASIVTMLLENRAKVRSSPNFASGVSSPTSPSSPFQSFNFMTKKTLGALSDLSLKFENKDNESLLSPGIDGYDGTKSETLLHIAATYGHDDIVNALLQDGEDIHKQTSGGWTALHNAAWFGRTSIVTCLIAAGSEPNARTNDQLTPLHCAVKNTQASVVEVLLRKGVYIEARDKFGLTAFHMACKSDKIAIMEILLDYGANIEERLPQNFTPLLWACTFGKLKLADFLLKRGADVNAKWVQILYHEAGRKVELGALGLAKAYRNEAIAQLVEKFGAMDSTCLASDEAKTLVPPEPSKEEYDTPEVQEIAPFEPEGIPEGDTENVNGDDEESAAESDDDESENISEVSDDENHSRQQSASGIHADVTSETQDVIGLGLEEVRSEAQAETQKDTGLNSDHRTAGALSGRFGRFQIKRVFSWKNEAVNEKAQVTASGIQEDVRMPAIEDGDPVADHENTPSIEQSEFANESPVIENKTTPKSPGASNEGDSTFAQSSPGKRIFSWKKEKEANPQ